MNRWKNQRTRIIENQGIVMAETRLSRQNKSGAMAKCCKDHIEQASVVILLSTYNAEEYLREQLDSLLAQTETDWRLVVRDDGSQDNTLAILEEYAGQYHQISYYNGENMGAKDSFFDLIKKIKGGQFDYVAFCDQDDYWLPEKLSRAIELLTQFSTGEMKEEMQEDLENELPLLYCGKPQLVDKELSFIQEKIKREIRPGFANALVENIVTGCTTVINRSMYEMLLKLLPEYCIMHDWWMYLVASCFGKVLYDEKPTIYYRQHGHNVMGIDESRTVELKHRVQKYKSRKSNILMQAEEFLRLVKKRGKGQNGYGNVSSSHYKEQVHLTVHEVEDAVIRVSRKEAVNASLKRAYLVANYKKAGNRLRLAFGKVMYRQRKMDDVIFRILFLFGLR